MKKRISVSAENSEFQIIESLKNNRSQRTKRGEIFVEGIESIKQAFNAGQHFTRIIYSGGKELSNWAKDFLHKADSDRIVQMSDNLFRRLCDKEFPSELIATVKMAKLSIADLHRPENPFYLVFDRPSDLGNFGTIVRTANSFNVDSILVVGHSIDVYDPKVIRSSLGSIFFTPVIQVESLESFEEWHLQMKKEYGMQLVGSDSNGEVSIDSYNLKKPITFILGNEAKGMSVALQELCDYTVSIPNLGNINSLNVSCAGSIILWEIFKNR